jgi:hypothetical protein
MSGRIPGWLPLPQLVAYRKAAPNKRDYCKLRQQRPTHVYLKNQTPAHLQYLKRSATSFATCCQLTPLCNNKILYDLTETQLVDELQSFSQLSEPN